MAAIVMFWVSTGVAAIGGLFILGGQQAMRAPIHHDGIGGKDTDNLMAGCLGPVLGLAFVFLAIIMYVVTLGLWIAGV